MPSINSGQQAEQPVADLNSADVKIAGPGPEYSPVVLDWKLLVENIQAPSQQVVQEGMEELYRLFSGGVRFYLRRHLGPVEELEDKIRDTLVIVAEAIRRGAVREPERLVCVIRTIATRQAAAYVRQAVRHRRSQAESESPGTLADANRNPEERASSREHESRMVQILRSMSRRDRGVLTRFYLHEQDQEQICRDMGLTERQFRLLKSGAKARFVEAGRRFR